MKEFGYDNDKELSHTTWQCCYRSVQLTPKEDSGMSIDNNKITKEMIEKAMKCETADELLALAKEEGFDLTKEEPDIYPLGSMLE